MKRSVKAAAAGFICAALTVSAAACATSQTYPLTIDGEQIRAGIYIFEQQSAVNEAKDKISEDQPELDTSAEGFDYLKQTIDGKSFTDWVNEKTIENCREYIAEKRLFASNGLTLTDEQNASVKSNVDQLWDESNIYAQYLYGTNTIGEYFEKMGIGRQSFRDLQEASEMRQSLFDHLYGEGGELSATDEELNAALKTDYAAVCYFEVLLDDGDAQSYVDRIKAGESYETIYAEHANAYLQQEYEKDMAEYEAALEAAQGVTVETGEGEEEFAPQEPEEPVTINVPAENATAQIIQKDSTTPDAAFVTEVFAMADGDVKVISVDDGDHTDNYVVKKIDILTQTDKTADAISSLRTELREDEFEEMLKNAGSGYTVTEDSSKNLYKIAKILELGA